MGQKIAMKTTLLKLFLYIQCLQIIFLKVQKVHGRWMVHTHTQGMLFMCLKVHDHDPLQMCSFRCHPYYHYESFYRSHLYIESYRSKFSHFMLGVV